MTVRFLFLVGQLRAGGSERQVYYLVRGLQREALEPAVCVWNYKADDVYVARLKRLDIPVLALPQGGRLQKMNAFRRIVHDLRPEVVHSYSFYTNFAAYYGARGTPARAIGSVRSDFLLDQRQLGPLVSRLNARWPRRQVFNSHNAFENVRHSGGFFVPAQCCVVRNGIDLDTFRPLSLSSGAVPRILGVGSLIRVKRWDRLVEAAAVLKARGAAFSVEIIGEGSLRGELEAQIAASALQDCVTLPGYHPDVAAAMQQADMLVHPSETEGCPNVVMEAMACGLPVVANRVGESRYLVEDGTTGFLIERGDAAALVDRISRLLDQPALRRRMGARGRVVAEQTFGVQRFVDEMLAAYVEMGWNAPVYAP